MFGRARVPAGRPVPARVFVHVDVVRESARLVRANPGVEVGGKLVGYRIGKGSAAPETPYGAAIRNFWQAAAKEESILLVGSIGSGPGARATTTSLHPDGAFQEGVYRALERAEPDVEHLGTWHSHHPNGLREFSEGDLRGYAATIADQRYNEDVFVAALCFDEAGLAAGVFDMYLRAAPTAPRRLQRDVLFAVGSIPSLQPGIADAEAAATAVTKPPEEQADPAVAAVETALRAAVGGAVERVTDDGCTSWIVTWPHEPDRTAVVMYTGGDPASSAISVTVRSADAQLTLSASAASQPAIDLSDAMTDAVRTLTSALRGAVRKGG